MKHQNGQPGKRMRAITLAEEVMRYTARWRRRSEANVLIVLALCFGKEEGSWAFPHRKTLAKRAGVGLRTVDEALHHGVADGILQRQQRPGSNRSSRYRFLAEGLAVMSASQKHKVTRSDECRFDSQQSLRARTRSNECESNPKGTRSNECERIEGHKDYEGQTADAYVKADATQATTTAFSSKNWAGGKITSGSQTQDQPAPFGSEPKKLPKPKVTPPAKKNLPPAKTWLLDHWNAELVPGVRTAWLKHHYQEPPRDLAVEKLTPTTRKVLVSAMKTHAEPTWWHEAFEGAIASWWPVGLAESNSLGEMPMSLLWFLRDNCSNAEKSHEGAFHGKPRSIAQSELTAIIADCINLGIVLDVGEHHRLIYDQSKLTPELQLAIEENRDELAYLIKGFKNADTPTASPSGPKGTLDVPPKVSPEPKRVKVASPEVAKASPKVPKAININEAIAWLKTEEPTWYDEVAHDPERLREDALRAYRHGKSWESPSEDFQES